MDDLCWHGEERFGPLRSRIYAQTFHWREDFVEFVVKDILSKNPRSVLDIGCGPGDILKELRDHRIELYGIDPSRHMLALAGRRIRNSIRSAELNVHLNLGSSRLIPFDRKFDAIFSSISFHHWANREESIPYILAMLENEGEFTIYEYGRDALSLLRKTILGRHALSEDEVKHLRFDGYAKTVAHAEPFIIMRFKKIG